MTDLAAPWVKRLDKARDGRRADILILRMEGRQAVASGGLRAIREAAYLTQWDIARELGVTNACVSRWESDGDRVLPRGENAERLGLLLRNLQRAAGVAPSHPSLEPERVKNTFGI